MWVKEQICCDVRNAIETKRIKEGDTIEAWESVLKLQETYAK